MFTQRWDGKIMFCFKLLRLAYGFIFFHAGIVWTQPLKVRISFRFQNLPALCEQALKYSRWFCFSRQTTRLSPRRSQVQFSAVHPTMWLEPSPHVKRVCERSACQVAGFLRVFRFSHTFQITANHQRMLRSVITWYFLQSQMKMTKNLC